MIKSEISTLLYYSRHRPIEEVKVIDNPILTFMYNRCQHHDTDRSWYMSTESGHMLYSKVINEKIVCKFINQNS